MGHTGPGDYSLLTPELDPPLAPGPGRTQRRLSGGGCLYWGSEQDSVWKTGFLDQWRQKRKTLILSDEFVDYAHPEMPLPGHLSCTPPQGHFPTQSGFWGCLHHVQAVALDGGSMQHTCH